MSPRYRLAAGSKRAIDVAVSSLLLVASAPVVVIAAFLIWITDRRSPIFVAVRCGRHGQPFRMYKLRTMVPNAEHLGTSVTVSDDHRITRVGRYLRRMKIDELPQLMNVVRGQMSLVGPRPLPAEEMRAIGDEIGGLESVRPGLTDISSLLLWDEAAIVSRASDPDRFYFQVVLPTKARVSASYAREGPRPLRDVKITAISAIYAASHWLPPRLAAERHSLVSELQARLGIEASSETLTPESEL